MNRIVLNIYIRMQLMLDKVLDFMAFVKFVYTIAKLGCFSKRDTLQVLVVINTFLRAEIHRFPFNVKVPGRNTYNSVQLFSALTNTYLNTKSERTCNQLMEVLKEEFIRRDEK